VSEDTEPSGENQHAGLRVCSVSSRRSFIRHCKLEMALLVIVQFAKQKGRNFGPTTVRMFKGLGKGTWLCVTLRVG
jgi:hypothetical protein